MIHTSTGTVERAEPRKCCICILRFNKCYFKLLCHWRTGLYVICLRRLHIIYTGQVQYIVRQCLCGWLTGTKQADIARCACHIQYINRPSSCDTAVCFHVSCMLLSDPFHSFVLFICHRSCREHNLGGCGNGVS